MVGGSSSISSNLNSAYASTTQALSDALTVLATGKKFQSASDDLTGFLRASKLQTDIDSYQGVKEGLTAAKVFTSSAAQVGSSVYEKLTKMKDLADKYATADTNGDTDATAEYSAEFDALKTEITNAIANAKVDGTAIYDTADPVTTVNVDNKGTTLAVQFTTVADATALDITDVATVTGEMTSAQTYLSEAKAFDGTIEQQINLNDTIMASKQAVKSLITDIDDAEGMSQVVDLRHSPAGCGFHAGSGQYGQEYTGSTFRIGDCRKRKIVKIKLVARCW